MEGFGKARFGGGKRTWFKLKDGDNGPYRIIGPIGDLAEDGRWSAYSKIHYGYKNSNGDMRTFESPEVRNRKTKMIDVRDAALDRINGLKKKLDEAKAAGNKELQVELLKLVGGQKSRFNLDSNHYMNVIDLQGNIGVLKIRHRAKLALDAAIKGLRDSAIEPLDPETGRFFTFRRSGMGMDTVYQVLVYKQKLIVAGVGEVEKDVIHTITPEIAARCLAKRDGKFIYKEAARLDTLFKKPTAEEVERIVRDGETAVDAILDAKNTGSDEGSSGGEDDSGIEDDAPVAATTAQNVTVAAPTAAPVVATETAPLQAQTVAPTAPPVTTPTPAPTVTAPATAASGAPKTTAQAVTEQSDADFLKSLGL